MSNVKTNIKKFQISFLDEEGFEKIKNLKEKYLNLKKDLNTLNEMVNCSDEELPHIQGKYEKMKKSISSNFDLIFNLLNDLNIGSRRSTLIEV